MKRTIIMIVLALLLSSTVLGMGLSPSKTRLTFQPGLERNFTIRVVNMNNEDRNFTIKTAGEQFITLFDTRASLVADEPFTLIRFGVRLPEAMEIGEHVGKVIVSSVSGRSGISTGISLTHKVIVSVPAELSQVSSRINATNGTIMALLRNPKHVPVSGIVFKLTVLEANMSIYNFSQANIRLDANSTKTLPVPFKLNREGEFLARYSVLDNDIEFNREEFFEFGTPEPRITVKEHVLDTGRINSIQVSVTNNWNKNYTARLHTRLQHGSNTISSSTSEDFSLPAYKTSSLNVFVDARGVEPGNYTLVLGLAYDSMSRTKRLSVRVKEGLSSVVKQELTRTTRLPIILGAVVILLLAGLIILYKRIKI
ncbi:MAG: hypothetical protein JRI71_16860 [Deltaproteobacteria bacterium]|nr:hypothetical protein [Deltaproteobacteria bacterium]